jgi:hypothetical protein
VVKSSSPIFEDDLSRLFDDDPTPAPEMAVQTTQNAPEKRKRTLMRLGGSEKSSLSKKVNPLQQATEVQVDLASILKKD